MTKWDLVTYERRAILADEARMGTDDVVSVDRTDNVKENTNGRQMSDIAGTKKASLNSFFFCFGRYIKYHWFYSYVHCGRH